MDRFQRYGNLLRNDGTNQFQRLSPALEPDYILPDERSLSDLLAYARELATQIRFFSLTGQSTGDWRPLLEAFVADAATGAIYDTATLETLLDTRQDWPPHLALFIVFLKLFQALQSDLNELPQRHLRHYYETELHLLRRGAQADAVHVIFELARNAAPTLIPTGTLLDAGKDGEGRPLYYATTSDLVINAAQIQDIRRLVGEQDNRQFRRFFAAEAISELEGESWYPFGQPQLQLDPSQRFMPEAQMGFALAAPILRLAEGHRTIEIRARLHDIDNPPVAQGLDAAFAVDLTGAEGWLTPETMTADLRREGVGPMRDRPFFLVMTLTLSETAPAVVAFDRELHGDGPAAPWPVVRCRFQSAEGNYEALTGLTVERAALSVTVAGVKNLVVQNSQGVLTPDQPMPLFGTQPRLGSPFYVGSAEVFSKKLTSLILKLTWQDLPEGDALFEHYRAYFDETAFNETEFETLRAGFRGDFVIFFDLLYNRSWHALLPGQRTLFEAGSTRQFPASQANFNSLADDLGAAAYEPQPQLQTLDRYRATTKFGFVRLTLQGPTRADTDTTFEAFGHQLFPSRYATQAIALSRRTDDSPGDDPVLPNAPITPTLASLSLNYSASVEFVPGDRHRPETFYRLEPFGYAAADQETARLVPDLAGEAVTDPDADFHLGALYIGLANFVPPGNIALLFQIERGTAMADSLLAENATEWSYLRGDRWTVLPRTAILNDSTYGFQEPGIVVLAIGRDASVGHTLMPPGQVWLRALIRQSPTRAARTAGLYTQAVTATFAPTVDELADYPEHLQAGLAADTIQRLQRRLAAIKTVQQPAPAFGGRASETDSDFFRRCSERLRHRHRAVTIWDLERLVLEAFPEIFKVKCLPHSDQDGQDKPGEMAIVVVPDVRAVPTLEPRASEVLIRRIQDNLNTGLATPFATIHVIHPTYERIRVDAQVAFRPGLDAGYYAGVLNEDLQRFLSPWAYEDGEDIVFGGQIYRSEILAFMEGRDYIDYITNFNLYHSHDGPPRGGIGDMIIGGNFVVRQNPQPVIAAGIDGMVIGDTFIVGQGVEVAIARRPQTILVSHVEHRIIPLLPGEEQCPGVPTLGIGYMTIGLDFAVVPPAEPSGSPAV